jgi:hypothetical protein
VAPASSNNAEVLKMQSPPNEDSVQQPVGIVEQLVRDDSDRKRLIYM